MALYQAAVARIGIASVYVLFLLHEYPNRKVLWGDRSPWTPEMAHELSTYEGGFSLLLWSPGRWWFEGLYLLYHRDRSLSLGWRTRICLPIFAVLVLSIQYRNSIPTTDGGDVSFNSPVIYLGFHPVRSRMVVGRATSRHLRPGPALHVHG